MCLCARLDRIHLWKCFVAPRLCQNLREAFGSVRVRVRASRRIFARRLGEYARRRLRKCVWEPVCAFACVFSAVQYEGGLGLVNGVG